MIGAERDHVAMAMVVSGMVVLAIHLEITDHRLQVTRMHRQPPLLPPGVFQLHCPEVTEQARRRRVSLSSLPVLEHIQTDGQQEKGQHAPLQKTQTQPDPCQACLYRCR